MNLSDLSLAELKRLQSKLTTEIQKREIAGKKEILKRIQKMAADEGLSMNDLLSGYAGSKPAAKTRMEAAPRTQTKKSSKAKSKPAAKFAHPTDPKLTWSGRGRKPRWFIEMSQTEPAPAVPAEE